MKIRRAIFLLAPALLMYSCAPVMSLHKWYADEDVVAEPGLAGTWYGLDDKGVVDTSVTLTIAQDSGEGYTLSFVDDAHPELNDTYALYVFRLKGQLFVDSIPAGIYNKAGKEVNLAGMVPAHMVGKIAIDTNDIRMDFLDDDWVRDTLKSNPNLIRNERDGDDILLTAALADLQQFLLNATTNEKAFTFTVRLRRTSAVASTPAVPSKQ